ncbi:MAG: DUF4168 domain-containing protein [Rhodospirillales bacterium]|nr:MAG: DUF4168 domain-containing protein [Rhodospirillales bacterium]
MEPTWRSSCPMGQSVAAHASDRSSAGRPSPAGAAARCPANQTDGAFMTYPRNIMLAILALVVALGLGTVPAMAQDYGASVEANYSEEELRSYAAAAIEVQRINETFQPQLQAAETPEEVQAVREQATGQMVEAVEDEGLSVDRYNQIFQAAQADPEVAEQISRYVQEMQ